MTDADLRLQCDTCREWYLPEALRRDGASIICLLCNEAAELRPSSRPPPLPPGVEVRQATDAEQREALEQVVGRRRPPRYYSRRELEQALRTEAPPPDLAELAGKANRMRRLLDNARPPVWPRGKAARDRAFGSSASTVGLLLLSALLCIGVAWLIGPR